MTALLVSLLANPTVLAILGGIGAAFVAFFRGRQSGASSERTKQAEAERKARTIADQVDNDVGAMPPDARREELKKWSR